MPVAKDSLRSHQAAAEGEEDDVLCGVELFFLSPIARSLSYFCAAAFATALSLLAFWATQSVNQEEVCCIQTLLLWRVRKKPGSGMTQFLILFSRFIHITHTHRDRHKHTHRCIRIPVAESRSLLLIPDSAAANHQ